jgi:hypothetical protein
MQFATLFVGWPQPTPTFTILLFQNKGKKKRGKKGVFL